MKKRLFALLIAVILPACFLAESYIPSSFIHQTFYFEADSILAEFDDKVKDSDFEGAAKLIQEGIEKSGSTVIKSDTFEFGSSRAMFTRKLLSSVEGVVSAYRMFYDPKAEELYNKALLTKDKNTLKDLLDIYGASSYAEKAGQTLADSYLSKGDFDGALLYLNRIKMLSVSGMFKKALCFEQLGDKENALHMYNDITSKYASYTLEAFGQKKKAGEFAAELSAALSAKPDAVMDPLFKSGFLALKWEGPKLTANKFEISEPDIAGNALCIVLDKTFRAFDLEWGAEIFKFDVTRYKAAALFPVLCGAGVSGEGNMVAVKFFASRADCVLFDLAKKENIPYLNGEQISADRARLFNGVLNLPLVKDNALYLGLISKKENLTNYYLTKLGRSKGEIIWSLPLGSGMQSQFMFENAPAPIVSGDDIIVETNLFTVACADRERGVLEWSFGCPPETEVPEEDRLFVQDPPYRNLTADGSIVFYFPKQKKNIIAISKADGKQLWSVVRGQMEYLVGESGDNLFTSDISRIHKLDKKTGKQSELFNLTQNRCSGKVSFFNGRFYFPASGKDGPAIGTADKNGQNFVSYTVLDKVTKVFPVKDGIFTFSEDRLMFYQDSAVCAASITAAEAVTPVNPAASYAGALMLYSVGKTAEAMSSLKKLGMLLKDEERKEAVAHRLEQLTLSQAGELFNNGDYKGAVTALEELEVRSAESAWLLTSCYEKLGDAEKAGLNFKKIIDGYKGRSLEPEAGLVISADYFARVKQEKLKEVFAAEKLWLDRNFDITAKPLWKVAVKGYSPVLLPFFTGEKLIFALDNCISALELETGKPVGEVAKIRKNFPNIAYGAYGFHPLSSAGDSNTAYFCTPDFNVFGVDTAKLSVNFEWKPETPRTPAFAPYSLGLTQNLLLFHDPSEGFTAIEKKDRSVVYRINGEFSKPCFFQDSIFAVNKKNMILYRFEAATGFKIWEHNLQSGSQNLEIKCDGNALYIITEEGVIYKVKQDNGSRLLARNVSPEKGGFDLFPFALSANSLYISTGRNIICVDKASLAKNWTKDTFTTYKTELPRADKKGKAEEGKVQLVEKPAELQKDISWLYVAGDKLLAFAGENLETYDTVTGKAELWGEKSLKLLPGDKLYPAYAFEYNNKLIVGKGPAVAAFPMKR